MRSAGWVVVVSEGEDNATVALVKGPFETFELAEDWAEDEQNATYGHYTITHLEEVEK
jgi:hypothetical protein